MLVPLDYTHFTKKKALGGEEIRGKRAFFRYKLWLLAPGTLSCPGLRAEKGRNEKKQAPGLFYILRN
jgi:hypothetical protein